MAFYRLRRVLRSKTGGGSAFDSTTIEAEDVDAAIRAVREGHVDKPGFELATVVLTMPSGQIVWTGNPKAPCAASGG